MEVNLKVWRDKTGIHIRHPDGVWCSFPDEAAIAQYVKVRGGNVYDDCFRPALKQMLDAASTVKLAETTKTEGAVTELRLTTVEPVLANTTALEVK